MAVINKNNSKMEFPLQIKRQYAGPIEANEIFYNLEEAKIYAKSGATAYAGQTIKVIDEAKKSITVYTIQIDGSLKAGGNAEHTHTPSEIIETAEKRFVSDADKTKWNDKYTKQETDKKVNDAKTEINSRIDNLEAGRVWKPSVDTFSKIAETYPTPQDTWCVITKDTNIIWMYDAQKTQWIDLGHSVVHDNATTDKDGLMSKEDKTKLDNISSTIDSKIEVLTQTHNTDKAELEKQIQAVGAKLVAATEEQIDALFADTHKVVGFTIKNASEPTLDKIVK